MGATGRYAARSRGRPEKAFVMEVPLLAASSSPVLGQDRDERIESIDTSRMETTTYEMGLARSAAPANGPDPA